MGTVYSNDCSLEMTFGACLDLELSFFNCILV